jgi:hypothetical protein
MDYFSSTVVCGPAGFVDRRKNRHREAAHPEIHDNTSFYSLGLDSQDKNAQNILEYAT